MDRVDLLAIAGALLLLTGLACVVYAIAGALVSGGLVLAALGVLLLLASRSATPEVG
jgi:hypothetical protein